MRFDRTNRTDGMTLIEVSCALTLLAAVIAATFGLIGQQRKAQARTAAEVQAYGAARAALHETRVSGVATPSSNPAEPGGLVEVDALVASDAPAGLRTSSVSARVHDRQGRVREVLSLTALDLMLPAVMPQPPSEPIEPAAGPSVQRVSLACDPLAGTITGEGDYPHGTLVEIVASPLPGHAFLRWEGATVSPNSATTHVLANSDKTLTAVFSP